MVGDVLADDVRNRSQQFLSNFGGFAHEIVRRTQIIELEIRSKPDEPTRKEARVVCEVDVQDGVYRTLS
jgi:hypothetical protein